MLFSILLIVMIIAIAFFHYIQGFFSATISAICTIFAALLAFSLHEPIVENFLGGKAANMAHAMVLTVLFAVIYLILRIILDQTVPGQIRLPAAIDKAGGGIMGLI